MFGNLSPFLGYLGYVCNLFLLDLNERSYGKIVTSNANEFERFVFSTQCGRVGVVPFVMKLNLLLMDLKMGFF